MENDWVKVFTTSNPIEAQIVLSMLLENEIEAVEMNKIDSSYTFFGRAEIYCKSDQVIMAKHLIDTKDEK